MNAEPLTDGDFYFHTFLCGHARFKAAVSHTGIAWCPTCGNYTGVMVERLDRYGRPTVMT